MAKVSKYPTREVSEINRFFRLFGTDDNDSKSPQVNIPVEVLLKYVLDNFSNDGDMVTYLPQIKEEFEKAIARQNIGAVSNDEVVSVVGDVIIEELKPQYHYFSNQDTVTINHGLGKYPRVTVMEGTEEIIPNSIEHTPDMNSITVTFIPETTGLIIIH